MLLVKRGVKASITPTISKVKVVEVSPSGQYFRGQDFRADQDGRSPDIYDYGWFNVDEIVEVFSA